MAEHAHTTPTTRRRSLAGTAMLTVLCPTLGAVAPTAAPLHPDDAELIALAARAIDADRRSMALCGPYLDAFPGDPAHEGAEAIFAESRAIMDAGYHPSLKRAAEVSARSLQALQAKARLVLLHLQPDDSDSALAVSLARDLLGGELT